MSKKFYQGQYIKNGSCCSVEGCDTPAITKNLCQKHYKRFLRHGDPLVVYCLHDGKRYERKKAYNKVYAKKNKAAVYKSILKYYHKNKKFLLLYYSLMRFVRLDERSNNE